MKLKSKNYFLVNRSWFEIIKTLTNEQAGELCRAFFIIANGESYESSNITINMVLDLFRAENGFR